MLDIDLGPSNCARGSSNFSQKSQISRIPNEEHSNCLQDRESTRELRATRQTVVASSESIQCKVTPKLKNYIRVEDLSNGPVSTRHKKRNIVVDSALEQARSKS